MEKIIEIHNCDEQCPYWAKSHYPDSKPYCCHHDVLNNGVMPETDTIECPLKDKPNNLNGGYKCSRE